VSGIRALVARLPETPWSCFASKGASVGVVSLKVSSVSGVPHSTFGSVWRSTLAGEDYLRDLSCEATTWIVISQTQ
jgi:hypothetical protein